MGGRGDMGDVRLQTDFERKKILQANTCHKMALFVRGNKLYYQRFAKKNSYSNQINHPPPQKSNGRPLICVDLNKVKRVCWVSRIARDFDLNNTGRQIFKSTS